MKTATNSLRNKLKALLVALCTWSVAQAADVRIIDKAKVWAGSSNDWFMINRYDGTSFALKNITLDQLRLSIGRDLSLNIPGGLTNMQKNVLNGRAGTILFLGDSRGSDCYDAVWDHYTYATPSGVQRGSAFTYGSRFFPVATGSWGLVSDANWWQTSGIYSMTNGATLAWGGPSGGGYVASDLAEVWYIADAGSGTITIKTSPDNSVFTTRLTFNSALGTGLIKTNVSIPAATQMMRIDHSAGTGSKNRMLILTAGLYTSASKGLRIHSASAGGQDLASFMLMGTNNIASLLTNVNPNLIVVEQIKSVAQLTNWVQVSGLIRTYAPTSDVAIVLTSPPGADNDSPTNNTGYINKIAWDVAQSNGWACVDLWTALGSWTNIIENGWELNDGAHVHFTSTGVANGYKAKGNLLINRLGLDKLTAALACSTNTTAIPADISLSTLTATGALASVTFKARDGTDGAGGFVLYSPSVNGWILNQNGVGADSLAFTNSGAGMWFLHPFSGGGNAASLGRPSAGYVWTDLHVTNAIVYGSETVNSLTVTQFISAMSAFSGATNNYDLTKSLQYFVANTPCAITGFLGSGGLATLQQPQSQLVVSNAASTNVTFYLTSTVTTPDGARSYVVTNGTIRRFSFGASTNTAAVAFTNANALNTFY